MAQPQVHNTVHILAQANPAVSFVDYWRGWITAVGISICTVVVIIAVIKAVIDTLKNSSGGQGGGSGLREMAGILLTVFGAGVLIGAAPWLVPVFVQAGSNSTPG